jgi:hypothetical protein
MPMIAPTFLTKKRGLVLVMRSVSHIVTCKRFQQRHPYHEMQLPHRYQIHYLIIHTARQKSRIHAHLALSKSHFYWHAAHRFDSPSLSKDKTIRMLAT